VESKLIKKINLIKLIWIDFLNNRLLMLTYILFFIFILYFFSNPYVNNSGDFITTSNYLIFLGLIFTFLCGFNETKRLANQLNIELLTLVLHKYCRNFQFYYFSCLEPKR